MAATVDVVHLKEGQLTEAANIFTRAFSADPLFLYFMPDPTIWPEKMGPFMEAVCRLAYPLGHSYTTAGIMHGVALWLPPGETDLSPERAEAAGFGPVAEIWGEAAMGRFATSMAHLEELHHRDMPAAHWYLLGLGVDPPWQGQGIGGHLLQPILQRADASGQPCYLETQRARNVPFYQRHGFEVVVETDIPAGGPHIWTMRRPPRLT